MFLFEDAYSLSRIGDPNDEWYTRYEDCEEEYSHYTTEFRNSVIYCNCDNPNVSNIYLYFKNNFHKLGLKQLISTYYGENTPITYYDGIEETQDNSIVWNGSFLELPAIDILESADIVVSNPPFSHDDSDVKTGTSNSLAVKWIRLCNMYNKKFISVIPIHNIALYDIVEMIRDKELFPGYSYIHWFNRPNGDIDPVGVIWVTNMQPEEKHLKQRKPAEPFTLPGCKYKLINRSDKIPYDIDEVLVPLTYFNYSTYDPDEFDVIKSERIILNGKAQQRLLIRKREA